jgi:hypothetical protein
MVISTKKLLAEKNDAAALTVRLLDRIDPASRRRVTGERW